MRCLHRASHCIWHCLIFIFTITLKGEHMISPILQLRKPKHLKVTQPPRGYTVSVVSGCKTKEPDSSAHAISRHALSTRTTGMWLKSTQKCKYKMQIREKDFIEMPAAPPRESIIVTEGHYYVIQLASRASSARGYT